MKALRMTSLDPAYNLALEETLFDALAPGLPGWFLIWQNGPSIIVGRHQNTLEEINLPFIQSRNLYVIRRPSGGGAVYHDTGNVNFSFLLPVSPQEDTGFGRFLAPIVKALGDLGIQAEFSSRNDITVQGRKISGSAQRKSGGRMLHHGTMLVDLDSSILNQALTGSPDKYQSKGVSSHKSRVANLREFLPQNWSREQCLEAVISAMLKRCADGETNLSPAQEQTAQALADAKYRTWDWNYGKSPEFTERRRKRFAWGALECLLNIKDGIIQSCRLYGDFFAMADATELERAFTGLPSRPDALRRALAALPLTQYFAGSEQEELLAFFCDALAPDA
jgi:lipoate-protein ligase A